mmetsp:Transcript_64064/g.149188  ORF Transcript_64064/g.149188 Transcript_64064/m.149188 type:complete len:220 (+) Transcript_64064:432-1091(+)
MQSHPGLDDDHLGFVAWSTVLGCGDIVRPLLRRPITVHVCHYARHSRLAIDYFDAGLDPVLRIQTTVQSSLVELPPGDEFKGSFHSVVVELRLGGNAALTLAVAEVVKRGVEAGPIVFDEDGLVVGLAPEVLLCWRPNHEGFQCSVGTLFKRPFSISALTKMGLLGQRPTVRRTIPLQRLSLRKPAKQDGSVLHASRGQGGRCHVLQGCGVLLTWATWS